MLRKLTAATAGALLTTTLLATSAQTATADAVQDPIPDPGRHTFEGKIDGAQYRVETPEDWNGTLLLYSHGYIPSFFVPPGQEPPVALTNRPLPNGQTSEQWLLDHGYALAASNYKGVTGYQVQQGAQDQIKLLDWFEREIGTPERTISTGQSLGGVLAVKLAAENPGRFDGVATFCAEYDPVSQFNTVLDLTYAIVRLLDPAEEIDLVHPGTFDEAWADLMALHAAVDKAFETPDGRAKLALIGSLNNISGWYSARYPEPANDLEFLEQQKEWVKWAYGMLGTLGRIDLEARAGGNPSWNTGIDYKRQFHKSAQGERVRRAYAHADQASLKADLAALNAGPRIAADPQAVEYLSRDVATGNLRVPTLTLHSTGDGGAIVDQERWYAEQARKHGKSHLLRNTWVERGGHCTISGAEEIVAIQSLERRIETGRWPNLSPARMNAAAAAMPDDLQYVFDFSTDGTDEPDVPKFTRFMPPRFLRPTH
ncbi:alpha/beta hydrolase family protein [Nocardioides speluncae]|uniref:alpha/beta hydrolase family protein n=1 Tax=Nocardioides speluncae TaxID=2670337 RepID=UPI000D69D2EC|nr:alpha/beta hydrolase-fold protein [Nocardioides speluncae]